MERAVDRVSRVFIPGVLVVAALTFAGWLARTGPSDALLHAIAVLVIACPCALGIATPLALTNAVAAAARRGILVSDARVLETIRAVDVVVLDKTGTATTGEFQLLATAGDTSRIAELAAVEACSEHPIGRAMAGQARGLVAHDICVHTGQGISGVVGETRYFLGNRRMMEAYAGQAFPPVNLTEGTVVYFGWDGAVHGMLSFGDPIRSDAAALCSALRSRGIRTVLLSGDASEATAPVAAAIGADEWIAEASPEQKIDHIRRLQSAGARVAMIGDGVNDAPSLAQADLGIALGSGTDIAVQAAPLVLMGSGLGAVVETLDLSRRAFRVVRQNLFWAFGYNTAGITLAVLGILNPILAAAAMVLSSVSVIANSRRLA
jgi:heavy metal translocating P-type ATPase